MTRNERRKCLHCGRDSYIIKRRQLDTREFLTLDCSHECAYLIREEDRVMSTTAMKRTCVVCDDPFETWIKTAWGELCQTCRQAFGVRSDSEASDVVQMMNGATLKDRLAMRESAVADLGQRSVPSRALVPVVTQPVKPKVDQEKVAAGIRMMVEYGRLAHEVTAEAPLTQPTSYVLAKNGLFEVRHSDVADIITQPTSVIGLTQEMKPGVRLNVPQLPFRILSQTVAFFREVCDRRKGSSEAFVQIWWNTVERQFHVHVPEQNVSGGGVRHHSSFDREGQRTADDQAVWLYVMDIHSHGSGMSAFWSSVDDGDERKAPEGRMFGVIGKVKQPLPEWKWRMRTREGFIPLTVSDIFAVDMSSKVTFEVPWDTIMKQASVEKGVTASGHVLLECPVDPFRNVTCPQEWHEQVKEYTHAGGGWGGRGSYFGQQTPIKGLIYLQDADGRALREFEVDGDVTRATGVVLELKGAGDGR